MVQLLLMSDAPQPNLLAMDQDERERWYEGVAAVLVLMTLLAWLRTPTLCRYCAQEAVDLVDIYEQPPSLTPVVESVPMCDAHLHAAEAAGCAVYAAGAEPHLA